MKHLRKALCMLLALVMVIGLLPIAALAVTTDDNFDTMVLIDCGRGYYSVDQIKEIIDEMATANYDYLMLGFGNDGLRFLLNDMSVEANDTTYSSDTIKNAIIAKNDELAPNAKGQWSQNDMDTIVSYAQSKGIEIVPMIDTPGHATSITAAMTACGIEAALSNRNGSSDSGSTTFDVTNAQAVAFAEALQQKYIDYFQSKGVTAFNLGMDEYAGNNGGWSSMNSTEKAALETYLADMNAKLTAAGMKTYAFCDVIGNSSNVPSSVVGINWNGGYLKNNSNINANQNWYYVLGATGTGWAGYDKALSNTKSTPVTTTVKNTAGAGSLLAIWNDNYLAADSYIQNIKNLIKNQSENNPMYFTVAQEPEKDPEVPSDRDTDTITVFVGESVDKSLSGSDYAETYTTDDPSIATVTVTAIAASEGSTVETAVTSVSSGSSYYIKDSNGRYLNSSGQFVIGTANAALWTWNGTTLKNGSNYLRYSNNTWTTSTNRSTTLYFNNGTFYGSRSRSYSGYTYSNPLGSPVTLTTTEPVAASTKITFTGVSVGTTKVTIGDTEYTIIVTENLEGKTLTYYPFISDFAVYPEGTTSGISQTEGTGNAQTLAATAAMNTENGVELASLVWATGDWAWEGPAETVYWKGVVHHAADTKQVGTKSDQSLGGEDFAYIRYLNGSWAVSADRETWTNITADDEVCVYYLQKTEITAEVTTFVKDWAFTTKEYSSYGSDSRGHKALSVAVVYPDGQMSPTADNIYSDSTLIYWYTTGVTSGTDTMLMRFGVNDVYEVSKITYTFGSIASESADGGSLEWNTKPDDDGNTWYDETTYWDDSKDTEPVLKTSDFLKPYNSNAFDEGGEAMLVLIYLKPVVTEDSLKVQYWDDSANTEILNYAVNIENKSTDAEKGTFLNRLVQKSDVNTGELTLDDNAYVVNYAGTNETFEKNLTAIPSLRGGTYATGYYQYVKAELSEDGKTLILHYDLNPIVEDAVKYVIDFGLPIEIPVSNLLPADSQATVTKVTTKECAYANLTVNGTSTIIYTPNTVLKGQDAFKVTLTLGDDSTLTRTVIVYPATSVYYEEGFASYADGWSGGSKNGGITGTQTAQIAGSSSDEYGYDAVYNNKTTTTCATSSTKYAEATFTFKGTGVDIYAKCTQNSGNACVEVYKGSAMVKLAIVSTASKSSIYTDLREAEYCMPIVSLEELGEYGEYTVKVCSLKGEIYLDGFRVYGTMENEPDFYETDREDKPIYSELRDGLLNSSKVLNSVTDGAAKEEDIQFSQVYDALQNELSATNYGAIVIPAEGLSDTDAIATVNKMAEDGPKNELFLADGATVIFAVETGREVQVAMKGVNGTGSVNVTANDTTKSISVLSTTEMYYKVLSRDGNNNKKTITITNNSGSVISITHVKVCDNPNAGLTTLTEADLDTALESLGLMTKGDADGSGKLSLMDVAKAFQIATENSEVSKYLLKVLDMNGDGKLNIIDVSMIYAKYIGR